MKTALLLLLLALPAWGEDWTVNGKTLHNVVIGTIHPDRVEISFDGGVGTPMFKDLSPEVMKAHPEFKPDAAAAQAEAAAKQKAYLAAEQDLAATAAARPVPASDKPVPDPDVAVQKQIAEMQRQQRIAFLQQDIAEKTKLHLRGESGDGYASIIASDQAELGQLLKKQ